MSVTFDILDQQWPIDEAGCRLPPARMYVNLANANARDFLDWIGIDSERLYGEMPARQLAPLLRRRLWPANRERGDEGRPGRIERILGGTTLIDCGRPVGRLAEYAERLLALAEYAGDGVIVWS
jgi:hypothetical protein